jgi:predicted heme/steroid binding protein
MPRRRFTKKELRRYNGQRGAPAFVAYQGNVYDVSASFLWQSGRHQAIHDAGTDLTDEMKQAPHDADLLSKFPIIGKLVEDY